MTQTSSKPRLKNDMLGNRALTELYDGYVQMDDFKFEHLCCEVVQSGGGSQQTKDKIISDIRNTLSKSTKLKKAQDFILAGMGLGV